LPYLLMFWIYTLLIFQWAGTFHYAMTTGGRGFDRLKVAFVISNVFIAAGTLVLFVAFAALYSRPELGVSIAMTGSLLLALVTFWCGLGFIIYGCILARHLSQGTRLTQTKSGLAMRLKIVAVLFSLSFMGMAACLVGSISFSEYGGRAADVITAFYLGFDCLCVVTMVYLFFAAVTEMSRADKSKADSGSSKNKGSKVVSSTKGSTKNKDLTVDVEEPVVEAAPISRSPSVVVSASTPSNKKLSPAERRAQMRQSLIPSAVSRTSSAGEHDEVALSTVVGPGSSLEQSSS